jgi:hypothetical protein
MNWIMRRRHGALIDALRRSSELLEGDPHTFSTYWREERDHLRAVNLRLLRRYDPKGKTDRKAR